MENSLLLLLVILNTLTSVIFTGENVNIPALICAFTECSFTFVVGKIEVAKMVTIPVFCLDFLPAVSIVSPFPKRTTKYIWVSFWSLVAIY